LLQSSYRYCYLTCQCRDACKCARHLSYSPKPTTVRPRKFRQKRPRTDSHLHKCSTVKTHDDAQCYGKAWAQAHSQSDTEQIVLTCWCSRQRQHILCIAELAGKPPKLPAAHSTGSRAPANWPACRQGCHAQKLWCLQHLQS